MAELVQQVQEHQELELLSQSGLIEELTGLVQSLESFITPPPHRYTGMDAVVQKVQAHQDEKLLAESGVLEELTALTRDLQRFIEPPSPSKSVYSGMAELVQRVQEHQELELLSQSGLVEEVTRLVQDLQQCIELLPKPTYQGMDALAQQIHELNELELLSESGLIEAIRELAQQAQSFLTTPAQIAEVNPSEPAPPSQEPAMEATLDQVEPRLPDPSAVEPNVGKTAKPESRDSLPVAEQLSLFPGLPDDHQRKAKPRTPRAASSRSLRPPAGAAQPSEPGADVSRHQRLAAETRPPEPTRAADGVSPPSAAAPARSRLAELALRARELSEELERTRRTPQPERRTGGADPGIDAVPASDDRELHHDNESINPAQSESRNPAAEFSPGSSEPETAAAELDPADEPGLEPDYSLHPEASESPEPDSGLAEPDANQYESGLDELHISGGAHESIGDGLAGSRAERSVQPDAGANQWESEWSDNSNEQAPEASEVDPQAQALQAALALSQTWSDDQLLSIAAEVEDYFREPPPEPAVERAEQLNAEIAQLKRQCERLHQQVSEERQALEDLGPARSWKYLFGSDPKAVSAAQQQLEMTTSQQSLYVSRMRSTQATFETWQQAARLYLDWRHSDKGEQLHQYRDVLTLEPVQERIAQVHQTQEAIRQAQERERTRQEGLGILQEWQQTAIQLGRPQAYVTRIQEITEDYRQGKPLNESQRERLGQDYAEHQAHLRQAQVRQGGFER